MLVSEPFNPEAPSSLSHFPFFSSIYFAGIREISSPAPNWNEGERERKSSRREREREFGEMTQ